MVGVRVILYNNYSNNRPFTQSICLCVLGVSLNMYLNVLLG